jgi:hypothetical protein
MSQKEGWLNGTLEVEANITREEYQYGEVISYQRRIL